MSTEQTAPPVLQNMNATQLGEAIQAGWAQFVNQDSRPMSKRVNVWASSFRECDRQMVLDMTHGDTLPSFNADTLARFRRGNDRERDMLADLKRIGRNAEPTFEVVGEQERFELKDRRGRVVITGKIDCRLQFHAYKDIAALHGQRSTPVEAKAWNSNLTAKIHTFEDLFNNRWTKGGAYQLLAYIYAMDVPLGFLLLDRSGLPALIPVELYPNLDRIERFLEKAERAMDHKAAGTLPDYIADPNECKYCPFFGSTCNPPLSFGPGADVFTDPDVIERVERLVELESKLIEDGLPEYEKLDTWAKKQFRGVVQGICGNSLITGKWQKKTVYDLPETVAADLKSRELLIEEERNKYAKVDPKGKFSLQITRVV